MRLSGKASCVEKCGGGRGKCGGPRAEPLRVERIVVASEMWVSCDGVMGPTTCLVSQMERLTSTRFRVIFLPNWLVHIGGRMRMCSAK